MMKRMDIAVAPMALVKHEPHNEDCAPFLLASRVCAHEA